MNVKGLHYYSVKIGSQTFEFVTKTQFITQKYRSQNGKP